MNKQTIRVFHNKKNMFYIKKYIYIKVKTKENLLKVYMFGAFAVSQS